MFKDKRIHQEVMANQITGFLYGYLITTYLTIYLVQTQMFDKHLIGLITATVFIILSYFRAYSLRYIFKALGKKYGWE